jgi:hypothetical protein
MEQYRRAVMITSDPFLRKIDVHFSDRHHSEEIPYTATFGIRSNLRKILHNSNFLEKMFKKSP